MKRAAIYARVSTRGQKEEGTSLETQIEAMKAYAEKHGYTADYIFSEDYSGTQIDRPRLDEAKELAQGGEIDVLLIHSWDRLGRDMTHQHVLRYFFEERWGAKIICVTEPEMDDLAGRIYKTSVGMAAEISNYLRREATTRGKRAKAFAGKVVGIGPAPFGYQWKYEEKGGKQVRSGLEIDPDEKKTVLDIFRWFVDEDLSVYGIADRLTAERRPTAADNPGRKIAKKALPGVWCRKSVEYILSNPVYVGSKYYGKTRRRNAKQGGYEVQPTAEWIEVKVPRIVPHELWQTVQAKLQNRRRKHSAKAKYDYLLTGMIVCNTCGKRRIGSSSKAGGKVYRYYVCPAKRCKSKPMRADCAELFVGLVALDFLSHPITIERWLRKRSENVEDMTKPLKDELQFLEEREKRLGQEAERWHILFVKGQVPETRLDQEIETIEREKAKTRERRSQLEEKLTEPIPDEYIDSVLNHLRIVGETLGMPDQTGDERDTWVELAERLPIFSAYMDNDDYWLMHGVYPTLPGLPSEVLDRWESLSFEEGRRLLETMGFQLYADQNGKLTAFGICPEQGFRVLGKASRCFLPRRSL